jgi:hypothetical protein
VLDQVLGDEYGEIHAKVQAHGDLAGAETAALGMNHAEVAGIIAELWKLPPLLSVPMSHHHTPNDVKDAALKKVAEVVELSGRCADVFVDAEPAAAINAVRTACNLNYELNDAQADALLADIGKRTKEVASLFEINIGSATEYEAILKRANEALVDITLQSQQQATNLQQQNQELKVAATTDGLTGLSNRKRFDEFLDRQAHQDRGAQAGSGGALRRRGDRADSAGNQPRGRQRDRRNHPQSHRGKTRAARSIEDSNHRQLWRRLLRAGFANLPARPPDSRRGPGAL